MMIRMALSWLCLVLAGVCFFLSMREMPRWVLWFMAGGVAVLAAYALDPDNDLTNEIRPRGNKP